MIGVAFQGCACRAAFHAGVAAALVESGLEIRMTAGASSGSICAAALAAGHGARLPDLWRELAGRSVLSVRRVLHNRSIFDMSHIVRTSLRKLFGTGDVRASAIEALISVTRLRDLRGQILSSRDEADLVEPILASCFIPVFYGRPVKLRGDYYFDGGATDNLPIEALAARGATDVIAVLASHEGQILKSLRDRRHRPRLDGATLHVIKPSARLDIRSWDLDGDRMERAIEAGYRAGREFSGR